MYPEWGDLKNDIDSQHMRDILIWSTEKKKLTFKVDEIKWEEKVKYKDFEEAEKSI